MRRKNNGSSYSVEAVWENLDKNKPIYSLSTEPVAQYVWEDGKPTDKIASYKAGFTQDGADVWVPDNGNQAAKTYVTYEGVFYYVPTAIQRFPHYKPTDTPNNYWPIPLKIS